MFLWVYWHFDVKYLPCIVNCCTEVWCRMLRLCTYLLCVEVGAAHMFEPAADTPSVLQLSQTFSQWHLKASAWTCLFVQVVRPQRWNVSWKLDEELDKSVSWKECLFRLQEIRSQFDRSASVCVCARERHFCFNLNLRSPPVFNGGICGAVIWIQTLKMLKALMWNV